MARPSTEHPAATTALTALAPAIWGSTYILFTETLPTTHPWTVGGLRTALAGALLLTFRPGQVSAAAVPRVLALALVNIAVFSACLFTAAARLPGGVAATLASMQPLIVLGLASALARRRPRAVEVGAGVVGVIGVALISLTPAARPDALGVVAALAAAATMATGTVMVHRWADLPPAATLAGWQLLLGGVMLLPIAFLVEGPIVLRTGRAWTGLVVLVVLGTALPHVWWTRGIQKLGPRVAYFGLLSPLVAAGLGNAFLAQTPTTQQLVGGVLVLAASAFGIARATPGRSGRFHTRLPAATGRTPSGVAPRNNERFA